MLFRFRLALLAAVVLTALSNCSPKSSIRKNEKTGIINFVDSNLQHAYRQYLFFSTQIPDSVFPMSLNKKGKLVPSNSGWWCSGFYPGTLLLLQENFKNDTLKKETKEKLKLLKKKSSIPAHMTLDL